MATYDPITDSEIDPGSPGTSSLFTRIRDNPIAIAEGASGAPRVENAALNGLPWGQSDIGSSAVGIAELKTDTSSTSRSGSIGVDALPQGGSIFSMTTRVQTTDTSNNDAWIHVGRGWVDDATTPGNVEAEDFSAFGTSHDTLTGAWVLIFAQTSATATATTRAVTSSPPYDLGDGDVNGFVYCEMKKNGDVCAVSISADPPWINNTWEGSPKLFRKNGVLCGRWSRRAITVNDVTEGRASIKEYMKSECIVEECEITKEIKCCGMEKVPQPFLRCKGTPILLDPMSDEVAMFLQDMRDGDAPDKLLYKKFLKVDNKPIKRNGPPGVQIHKLKWRKR